MRPMSSEKHLANAILAPATFPAMVWRGKQVSHQLHTLSSGHAGLDAVLPGSGWPTGVVTELVNDTAGCGELSLLLPVLARLSRENHWIAMIDPPWIPYPPALQGYGLALEKVLLIRTHNPHESLWACEQVVRGISGGAMLAWPDSLSFGELRRLQLAAKSTRKMVFLFRHPKTSDNASPAALRLQLAADDDGLQIRVLKCRGQRPASSIRIRRSQLLHPGGGKEPSTVPSFEKKIIFPVDSSSPPSPVKPARLIVV